MLVIIYIFALHILCSFAIYKCHQIAQEEGLCIELEVILNWDFMKRYHAESYD
jgi:hypothetical protein